MLNKTYRIAFIIILLCSAACFGNGEQPNGSTSTAKSQTAKLIRLESPISGHLVGHGEPIDMQIKLIDDSTNPDSIVLYINDQRIALFEGLSARVATDTLGVGTVSLRATAWRNNERQSVSTNVRIKSNIKPKQLKYSIVRTYPHDPAAYTQGLFFYQGKLYESTGQNGASSLRRVELSTGKVLQSVNLNTEHFGEGAAIHGNRIYQLTWTSGVCFAYNTENLSLEATYSYNTQGWGLTSDGNELIMSDGSNLLRFMNPEGFVERRRVEVYDDQGPVRNLNELEYINGLVYANVYTTDRVVIIDPQTGVVVAQIDLSSILPTNQRTGREDVLNGIAYDAERDMLIVTGKYWPKMFEIKLEQTYFATKADMSSAT